MSGTSDDVVLVKFKDKSEWNSYEFSYDISRERFIDDYSHCYVSFMGGKVYKYWDLIAEDSCLKSSVTGVVKKGVSTCYEFKGNMIFSGHIEGESREEGEAEYYIKACDSDLKTKWSRKDVFSETYFFHDFSPISKPFHCNGLLLLATVVEDDEPNLLFRGYKTVLRAFNVDTGEDAWSFEAPGYVTSHWADGDMASLVVENTVYLIDSQTGELRHQMTPVVSGAKFIVQHDDKFLYCLPTGGEPLSVYSRDGHKVLNRIDIPQPYGLEFEHHGIAEDKLYLRLGSVKQGTFYHGLAVLDKTELASDRPIAVEYETAPDTQITCIKNLDDSDHYEITVTSDDKHMLRRYGAVAVLDVISRHVYISNVEPEEYNEDFNGRILLKLTGVTIEQQSDDILDMIRARIKEALFGLHIYASQVQFEVEWVQ